MRAWIEDVDDETVAFVHKAEGADLDRLITYCREKAENEKSRHDMKHVASVDQAVIIDWCNKRGITFQRFMNDQSLVNAFLDDPDNSAFRIWKGRV